MRVVRVTVAAVTACALALVWTGPIAPASGDSSLAPGQGRTLRNLTPGVHRYECLIHPWMRSTVVVR